MGRKVHRMVVGLVLMLSLFASGLVFAQSKPKMMPSTGMTKSVTTPDPAAAGMETPKAGLVDLNTADEAALTSLKGIGPVKAKAILKYRQDHGSFKSVDELKNVPGIGGKTLAALKPLVTVGSMGQ